MATIKTQLLVPYKPLFLVLNDNDDITKSIITIMLKRELNLLLNVHGYG